MSDWQPIETCPKDGTEFYGYDVRTKKQDVCVWWDFDARVVPVQSDGEYGPEPDEFGYSGRDIRFWHPLLEPPK